VGAADALSIGARARKIRRRRGLSLEVVAGLAGITKGYLSMLELGQRGFNRRGLIEDLAEALGCSVAPQDSRRISCGRRRPRWRHDNCCLTGSRLYRHCSCEASTLAIRATTSARPKRTGLATQRESQHGGCSMTKISSSGPLKPRIEHGRSLSCRIEWTTPCRRHKATSIVGAAPYYNTPVDALICAVQREADSAELIASGSMGRRLRHTRAALR
jgi:transcriptional regulator with XRE-family HTH domain